MRKALVAIYAVLAKNMVSAIYYVLNNNQPKRHMIILRAKMVIFKADTMFDRQCIWKYYEL